MGWGDAKGRGGKFRGGAANLTLTPAAGATHPDSGLAGDLYVDKGVRLWLCKGGASWVQLG